MSRLLAVTLCLAVAGCSATGPSAPTPPASAPSPAASSTLPSIAAKTAGLDKRDGFVPVYWDAAAGKVWLEVRRLDTDLLHSVALAAGLGSNDVGLDRSQLGGERVVRFERVGRRVFLVQPNLRFRAGSDNPAERLAVEDAFAQSVVWGFDVAAETGGRVLIDATDFVVRDAHGVADQLRRTDQGTFSLDRGRSAPVPSMLKAFPRNTELEARLTFASSQPGRFVRDVAADPQAVTVRVRQSFIALPEPGYAPRAFAPAAGYFPLAYADYAVPIGEDLVQRVITRHRLTCAAPPEPAPAEAGGVCTAAEPIVYYLDPGTPEPVRSALLDGARWWADAFEAAGWRDAYRVEVRPDSIDPLDARYSTIQWVHRATRGWSYGSSIVDPRTGEILKGHVSLGSLRVRQDYLLAEGLLAPYTGADADGFASEADDPMLQLALARLRQLSAHEVGHTIGLAHNFAGSTQGRTTVMDYPAPLARLVGGDVDLSEAYAVGVGEWDVQAVRYGYVRSDAEADRVLEENRARGLRYITDADARPAGAATPTGALWDNGADAVQSLRDEMAVRRAALDRFSEAVVREGRPLATMEEVLVPLYLRHRYQVDATAHLLGGVAYGYALRGDGTPPPAPVDAATQRAALEALLDAVEPEALALPAAVRDRIPPRPPGHDATRELFAGRTGVTLDPVAPAETAAALVFEYLFEPARAARLVYQHDRDPSYPGFADVMLRAFERVQGQETASAYHDALRRSTLSTLIGALIALGSDRDAAPAVLSQTEGVLEAVADALQVYDEPPSELDMLTEDDLYNRWLSRRIERFLDRDHDAAPGPEPLRTPPGSPIGN